MKLNTLVAKYTDILILKFAHIIYPQRLIEVTLTGVRRTLFQVKAGSLVELHRSADS